MPVMREVRFTVADPTEVQAWLGKQSHMPGPAHILTNETDIGAARTIRNDRYNYLYKPKELEGWKENATHIAEWAEKTFVVANNHSKGQAAVNALELKSMLGQPKSKRLHR
jgi:uncharacterized protein YecE (DUF72 family)